jgi:hypothetical protein
MKISCRFRKLVLVFLGFLIMLFGKLAEGYMVNGKGRDL